MGGVKIPSLIHHIGFALAVGMLLPAMAVLAGCRQPLPPMIRYAPIAHRGLEGAVEISAGPTRLVVVPQWAGRISVLDFGQGNVLWQDPSIDGKVLPAADAWGPWDGNATDLMSADGRRQWIGLWLHPYPKVVPHYQRGERSPQLSGVEVSSAVNAETGLSISKRYELSADGRTLRYSVTVSAQKPASGGWTVWERALVPATTYAVAPLDKSHPGPGPEGYAVHEGATVRPADRLSVHDGFLVVRGGTGAGVGVAARLRNGWIACVYGRHVLLISYPLDPAGKYPHMGGANAFFWLAPENLEIEPMSPQVSIGPEAPYTFAQVWRWLTLPESVSADDPAAVGRWISQQAQVMHP